jgi:glycosyltransferase involved in cell wall biosynthesis
LADKLKVLLAIGEMSGGGSQRQLLGILRRLDRQRFAPQLYLVKRGGELLGEVPPDVPVHVFQERSRGRYEGGRWWQRIAAFRARIRDLAVVLHEEQIDVVYDRTYHMTLIAAGATRRRLTPRVSVIVTDPRQDFDTNRERFRHAKLWLLQRAYRSAYRVVSVSEGVRQAAIDFYGLSASQVVTLHNFFDVEQIERLMNEPLPPAEAKQPGGFEIVAAGRLHPQKGFGYLLEAVRELVQQRGHQQVHLRILGTGPQEGELRSYVARHGLTPQVSLAGFCQNPLPYFRQADLFCLSSLYEGMPNALVEAMLCRVPVLATDCPSGPREILAGGQFGRLVPPASAAALADAIDDTIRHSDAWRSLTHAAQNHIAAQFSPAAAMQRLEELLLAAGRKS